MKKNRNRILILTPYNKRKLKFNKGGIAIWSTLFLKQAEANGVDVCVCDTSPIGKTRKNNLDKNLFIELIRNLKIIVDFIFKVVFYRGISVVHINSSLSKLGIYRDLLCGRIAKIRKKKIIFHMHCDVKHVCENNKSLTNKLNKVFKLSDITFVLNKPSLSYCRLVNSNVNVKIIPNFISSDLVVDSKVCREVVNEISFVGFIHQEKGVDEIIRVANLVPKCQFTLVGSLTPKLTMKDFPSNVTIIQNARREDVFRILDNSDIFLFPSHTEGFSLALLEAMSRGLPIICTNVGANAEMVNKGGVVVSVGDVDAMICAINSMESVKVRQEYSVQNIRKVKSDYLADIVFKKILEQYRTLNK